MTALILAGALGVAVLSLLVAPRRAGHETFFGGQLGGQAPGLWTLTLSQVTTWIFARSLMNAAILGYYYGIAGTLAYAAYYLSFLTGGYFVHKLRADGAGSVQGWLSERFGITGTSTYNLVIALRLLSEVFANLIVVGLIFEAVAPGWGVTATLATAAFALAYSAWGGLGAALRTDVVQMSLFLVAFGAALIALFGSDFSLGAALTAEGASGARNGWVLLVVALLQVVSYPVHDPVMMDRGFVADPRTTRLSFLNAFWISTLCILGFGLFGIHAAVLGASYENQLLGTWALMFPPWVFAALMISLLVSALSTLDSALSSAARLSVEELGWAPRSLAGGRAAMAVFAAAGTLLTLWGNATLFDAVAVSGTASMFLAPVMVAALMLRLDVPLWSYLVAWVAAMGGAFAYFARSWPTVAAILPDDHKYVQLLAICVVVLIVGGLAVAVGARRARPLAPAE